MAEGNVNTLLDDHVTLRYASVDRLILNGYVPHLQTPEGLARFLWCDGEELPRYAILGERTAALNPNALRRAWEHFEREIDRLVLDARLEPAPRVGSSLVISRPQVL